MNHSTFEMKLLNQLKYRIAFSLLIGFLYALYPAFYEGFSGDTFLVALIAAVVVYIPMTLFWAIISTFFMDEESNQDENIVDS